VNEEIILSLSDVGNLAREFHNLVVEFSGELVVLKNSIRELTKLDLISNNYNWGLDSVPIYGKDKLVSSNS
jgi:hypothetical protein